MHILTGIPIEIIIAIKEDGPKDGINLNVSFSYMPKTLLIPTFH
ncbi:hypothetical protein B4064_1223 [Caldibacillus thermoamylovorans]|nr:hypothetical protein B4064_1223 [Caldibacillus thermoamylovorans]